jgi:hypothetical protein
LLEFGIKSTIKYELSAVISPVDDIDWVDELSFKTLLPKSVIFWLT